MFCSLPPVFKMGVRLVASPVSAVTTKWAVNSVQSTTMSAAAWFSATPLMGWQQAAKDNKRYRKVQCDEGNVKDSGHGKQPSPCPSPAPPGSTGRKKQDSFETIVAGTPGNYNGDRFLVKISAGMTYHQVVAAIAVKTEEICALLGNRQVAVSVGKIGIKGTGDHFDKDDPETWDSVALSKRFLHYKRRGYRTLVPLCACDNQTSQLIMPGYPVPNAERLVSDLIQDVQTCLSETVPETVPGYPRSQSPGDHAKREGNIKPAYCVYVAVKI